MEVTRGKGWEMHLGDCVEVMSRMACVDHVITDPPYEAEAHTKGRRVRRGQGVEEAPLSFASMTAGLRAASMSEIGRLARRWSLVFCQAEGAHQWVASSPVRSMRWCVWIKPDGQPQLTGDRPGVGYETIVCFHPPGRAKWNGGGRTGVFTHNKFDGHAAVGGRNLHPTTKPIALMMELVDLFTDPGDAVLDPFAGSGTTGIACVRQGRSFVGIEKDAEFFKIAVERLQAEDAQVSVDALRRGQLGLL